MVDPAAAGWSRTRKIVRRNARAASRMRSRSSPGDPVPAVRARGGARARTLGASGRQPVRRREPAIAAALDSARPHHQQRPAPAPSARARTGHAGLAQPFSCPCTALRARVAALGARGRPPRHEVLVSPRLAGDLPELAPPRPCHDPRVRVPHARSRRLPPRLSSWCTCVQLALTSCPPPCPERFDLVHHITFCVIPSRLPAPFLCAGRRARAGPSPPPAWARALVVELKGRRAQPARPIRSRPHGQAGLAR